MRGLLDTPPVWLALHLAAAFAAGRLWPWSPAPALALALVLAGVALMLAAALTMWRGGATIDPRRPPTALVTTGVFALSRNPIYLADALILAGACLWWQPLALVLLVPFGWIITRRFIRREEGWLLARDPAAFRAWAARTRRWL